MSVFPWIIETLLASTLLIAVVLLLRRPAARLLGPHTAYLLWALPMLRLLLPPIPGARIVDIPLIESPIFAPRIAEAASTLGMQAIEAAPALPSAAASPAAFDGSLALLVLWLSVAVMHMLWHIVRYRRFIRGAVASQAPMHTLDGVVVYAADIAGPAAAGIVRRRIFLPHDFADRFDPAERRLALAHEVAHHRRGDLVANWFALAVLSLHWFNPLAHLAYRAFRADQEPACDATVLSQASAADRHAYASAVVKAAWVKSPVAACPMNSAGQLKARLAMMKVGVWSAPRRLAGLVIVLLMAGSALAATASRTAAALPEASDTFRSAIAEATDTRAALTHRDVEPAKAVVTSSAPAPVDGSTPAIEPSADPANARLAMEPPAPQTVVTLAMAEEGMQPIALSYAAEMDQPLSAPAIVQAVAHTPEPPANFPSPKALRDSAAAATKQLRSLPNGTLFRNVRAVMVDGRFNAVEPGQPYVGFCGELQVTSSGYGYRETGWRPFFVSTTPSQTPGRAAKCAGPRSPENLTAVFHNASLSRARTRSQGRNACTADQSACRPAFFARVEASQRMVELQQLSQ